MTEAIAFFPKAQRLYLSLGIALDRIEDSDGTISNYQKAILLDPDQASWIYITIVERFLWQNRLNEAVSIKLQVQILIA